MKRWPPSIRTLTWIAGALAAWLALLLMANAMMRLF
jgi:hypothetical protein